MEILTLAESIKALKFAGLCTYNYLNTLKLKYWPLLLGALIFLGWNGLQIIFSLNLIASFINDFKVQNSLSSTPIDNLRSIPIYIFSLISFIVFFWLMRTFAETAFTIHIREERVSFKKVSVTSLNFFAASLLTALVLLFIATTVAIFHIFIKITLAGFNPLYVPGAKIIMLRYALVFFFVSIITTTFMMDFILPTMCSGLSYRESLFRVREFLSKHTYSVILFYLFKASLIIITILFYHFALRHLIIPIFMFMKHFNLLELILAFSKIINLVEIVVNIIVFGIILLSALIIFAPIQAPFFIFQKYLLERMTFKTRIDHEY